MKAAPERYKVRVESEARASGPEYARARGERWPAHPPGRLLVRDQTRHNNGSLADGKGNPGEPRKVKQDGWKPRVHTPLKTLARLGWALSWWG